MLRTGRYIQFVVIGLGFLALFLLLKWLLVSAVNVLMLLFAGILSAVFVRGLSHFLFGRFGELMEKVGIAVTLLSLLGGSVLFIVLLAPQLADQIPKLAEELPKGVDALRKKTEVFRWLEGLVTSGDGQAPVFTDPLSSQVFGIFATTFGVMASFSVIFFVGLYLCFTPHYYIQGILSLLPSEWRGRAEEIFKELGHTLSHWLIGRFVGMLVVSIATYAGLLMLGIPLPLSLAVLAGVLTFIPNIGPILSAVPPVLLGYMQTPSTALYVIFLYFGIQAVESYLITPLVQQREVSLPPVLTLASQILFASVFGFLGLALATPLTASALVLVKMLYVEGVLGEKIDIGGTGSEND